MATSHALRPVYVVGLTVSFNSRLYNCAAVVCDGKVLGVVPKEKLPTYGVFYEARTFSAGIPGLHGVVLRGITPDQSTAVWMFGFDVVLEPIASAEAMRWPFTW